MNRFTQVDRDVREDQIYRDTLLAQPDEFFRSYFGTASDMMQRAFLVERLIQTMTAPRIFVNDTYCVRMRSMPPMIQLDICRHDGGPCKNWSDFQQIKNELVGRECEGVEIFPAESRLVDTANQYHIWVNPDANFRFPFGYTQRLVLAHPIVAKNGEAGMRPMQDSAPLAGDNTVTTYPMVAPPPGCR